MNKEELGKEISELSLIVALTLSPLFSKRNLVVCATALAASLDSFLKAEKEINRRDPSDNSLRESLIKYLSDTEEDES